MVRSFQSLLVVVIVAGLAAGAAFGAGTVYGRTSAPKTTPAGSNSLATGQGTGLATGGTSGTTGGAMGADFAGRGGIRGTVEALDGNVLTVKGSDGATTKVKVDDKTTIRKTVEGNRDDLKAGTTVMVAGDRAADGTVSATSIQLSPAFGAGATGGAPEATPRSRPSGGTGTR